VSLHYFDFSRSKILIVGDIMLDQFWHGNTGRISPEAPVPIVHVKQMVETLGGAANVALNIAALGGAAILLGVIGDDAAGDKIQHLLQEHNIQHVLEKTLSHPTITKLRIVSRNQQLIRIDTEHVFEIYEQEILLRAFKEKLGQAEVVIIADYNKGTLRDVEKYISLARAANIPVLVDPKRADFNAYRGATVITPNLKEFEAVVGPCVNEHMLIFKAAQLLKENDLNALVITRSEHGISVIQQEAAPFHIPANAREVFDVTGAGDTVIAVLALALSRGMDLQQAAILSNVAGGIVVGKVGTATLSLAELSRGVANHPLFIDKSFSKNKVMEEIVACRAQGERIVFTNGCFDILHAGHVSYLQEAKNLGDKLVVGINDDASIARLKGDSRPINTLENRIAVLSALKSVDWVVPFSEDTPEALIEIINPNIMVKGGDYKNIDELPGAHFVQSQGGTVQLLSLKEGLSTTHIINTMQEKIKETDAQTL